MTWLKDSLSWTDEIEKFLNKLTYLFHHEKVYKDSAKQPASLVTKFSVTNNDCSHSA